MSKARTLADWWKDHAADEAEKTVSKMLEYGSGDLIAIGHSVTKLADRPVVTDDEAFEIGCLFYLIGKMERVISAVSHSYNASDDTWFDIAVYAKMVQARRAGAWK
jgi:hypothetical protein